MISECNLNTIQCSLSNIFLSATDYTGVGYIFYDLPNLAFTALIIIYLSNKYKIPQIFLLALLCHLLLPVLLNGVIFPPEYMEDQFRYWNSAVQFRSLNFFHDESITVYFASIFLALVPVPFLFSVISIGIINKLIFALTFIYLYKEKFLNKWSSWFFLLYPSFALYSGLALRDTLVLFFMIIPTYMLIKNKYFYAFLLAMPLFILKFPIAPILYMTFIGYIFCLNQKGVFRRKRLLIYLLSTFTIYIIVAPLVLDSLNLYRAAMYWDDTGTLDGLTPMTGIVDLTSNIIGGLGSAFLSPSPLSSSGFQFIQSIENIFIFGALLIVIYLNFNSRTYGRLIFWFVSFLAIISIYSLVVFNLGTFSRYKFPMIAWFVLIMLYELRRTNNSN